MFSSIKQLKPNTSQLSFTPCLKARSISFAFKSTNPKCRLNISLISSSHSIIFPFEQTDLAFKLLKTSSPRTIWHPLPKILEQQLTSINQRPFLRALTGALYGSWWFSKNRYPSTTSLYDTNGQSKSQRPPSLPSSSLPYHEPHQNHKPQLQHYHQSRH